jgi:diguanylate cyclase (GGDEF)-like protein
MQTKIRPSHNIVTTANRPEDCYAQVLELLADLSRVKSEEEAIQEIQRVFRSVFSPQEIVYIALQGDLIISVVPHDTPPEISRSLIHQAKNNHSGMLEKPVFNVFPISNLSENLGLVAISENKTMPFDQRSLDIGRMLAIYSGVVISNIRVRQKLMDDEKLLRKQGTADAMTGLSSRRFFFEIAEAEFKRSKRYERPLSAILVDIDNFTALKEAYGPEISFNMIVDLSCIFTKELRDSDIRVRLGGEELLILLPETNLKFAQTLAERLRQRIEYMPFEVDQRPVPLTISLGVGSLDRSTRSLEEFINDCDKALHQARQGGGNQVAVWGKLLKEYEPVFTFKESDHRIGFY